MVGKEVEIGVFAALGVLFLLVSVTSSVVLWTRRGKHPLKARKPYLILLFNAVGIVTCSLACLGRILGKDSLRCFYFNNFLSTFYFSSFLVRASNLWFRFQIAYESMHNYTGKLSLRNRWFSSHSFFVSDSMIALYLVIIFIVLAVIASALVASGECDKPIDSVYVTFVLNSLLIIVTLIIAVKLKKEYDHFWLKNELKIMASFGIVGTVSWLLVLVLIPEFNQDTFGVSTLIAVIGYFVCLAVSTIYPSYLTRLFETKVIKHGTDDISTDSKSNAGANGGGNAGTGGGSVSGIAAMQNAEYEDASLLYIILKDQKYCTVLENFLIRELSSENLSFYKACDALQNKVAENEATSNMKACLDFASAIYEDFIKTKAPFQVNLSSFTIDQIETGLKVLQTSFKEGKESEFWAMCTEIYVKAQGEAVNLILTDSFVRFKKTKEAKRIISTKKTTKALRQAHLLSFSSSLLPIPVAASNEDVAATEL